MFLNAVGLSLVVVLPAGLGISMVAEPMVRLALGEQWLSVIVVIQVVAVASISAAFNQPAAVVLNAVGRPHALFYIQLVSTVIKLAALLTMVPRFGLLGASAAMATCSGIELVLFMAITLPGINVTLLQMLRCVIRPALASATMVAVLWLLGMAWTPSTATGYLDLCSDAAVRSLIGGVTYVSVLCVLWLVAGRPDGAEQFIIAALGQTWLRVLKALNPFLHRVKA
jgi:O-antigen/teichoic acid export membrane protein